MSRESLPSPGPHRQDLTRLAVRLLVVAVAYFVAAKLSLRFALVEKNVTPFWPPTGIALVALLIWGRSMWPAIAVAALAVNAPISDQLATLATAAGNTLAPVVAAELLRAVRFRLEMDRVRDALAIVFLAAPAMVISATIGSLALVLSGVKPTGGLPDRMGGLAGRRRDRHPHRGALPARHAPVPHRPLAPALPLRRGRTVPARRARPRVGDRRRPSSGSCSS